MANTETRKVTIELPAAELEKAMRFTGENMTRTLSRSLEAFNRDCAYKALLDARGKFSFPNFDINELREDRDEPWLS